jgi:O-antigen/teichoic acid export membrane protein
VIETRRDPPSDWDSVARFAQGVRVNLPVRFVSRALALAVQALLARLLGPEGFGRYAVGWNILRLVENLGPFGVDKAVIRLTAGVGQQRRVVLRAAIVATLALALVIGLGFWLLSPFLAIRLFRDPELVAVLRWFAPGFGLAAGLFVAGAAARATQQMEYSALGQDLAQPAINLVLVGLVFGLGVGLVGYVAAGVASYLLSLLLMIVFLLRLFPDLRARDPVRLGSVLGLLGAAAPIWLATLASILISRVDRIILPAFRPAEVVGVYQAASQFSTLFPIILSVFNLAYSPILAARFKMGTSNELNTLYRAGTKWGIFLSLPAFVVLFVVPEALLVTVFGTAFAGGAQMLQVLMIGQLVNVCTGASGTTLIMTGQERSLARIAWAALLFSLLVSFALIPRLGAIGAAIAASTAQVLLNGGALQHIRSTLGLWPYDRTLVKGLVSAMIAGVGLALLTSWIDLSPLQTLLLSLGFVGLAYSGAMLLLGLDEEDRTFLRQTTRGILR